MQQVSMHKKEEHLPITAKKNLCTVIHCNDFKIVSSAQIFLLYIEEIKKAYHLKRSYACLLKILRIHTCIVLLPRLAT